MEIFFPILILGSYTEKYPSIDLRAYVTKLQVKLPFVNMTFRMLLATLTGG